MDDDKWPAPFYGPAFFFFAAGGFAHLVNAKQSGSRWEKGGESGEGCCRWRGRGAVAWLDGPEEPFLFILTFLLNGAEG